jgi:pyruvate, water dikinase
MTQRPTSPYLVWFDEYQESDHDRVGGKCASLGTMMHAGLPVPPGFAVTTDAYESLRREPTLAREVNGRLGAVSPDDPARLQVVSREVRALIEQVPLADEIATPVAQAYEALCRHCGVDDVPVAVRSSATAEDLPDASFAGQQDTYLWVQGSEAVLEHMKRCWSSIFTDRAIAYRRERGHDHEVISMSVGIQKMVDPKAAGVAFTLNPLDGDRSQVAIDASWGLGEAVVSGEVTPDNYLVDKVIMEIVSRKVSDKGIEYRVNGQGVEVAEIEPERRSTPCLTDDEIRAITTMAKRAERHYGRPQDIEWAIDRHLPDGENVILLQSRPETVWSNKPRTPVAPATSDPMAAIVATLMAPMHTNNGEVKARTTS